MKGRQGFISRERRAEVVDDLDQSADVDLDYILLVLLSCVIATFGLILDSGPVIIGAMLIAPLMSPILASSLSMVRGDLRRLGRALGTLLLGVLLATALSTLLGRLVSARELNFLIELPTEILDRTQPTLFDLAIGLAGGAAAAYAMAQPHLSATLPGVAIATALMPPICVMGIGLSQGRMDVSGGALLLFLSNLAAIMASSSVVFAFAGFGPIVIARRRVVVSRALILSTVMLLLVSVPLVLFMVRAVSDSRENAMIREALVVELAAVSKASSHLHADGHTHPHPHADGHAHPYPYPDPNTHAERDADAGVVRDDWWDEPGSGQYAPCARSDDCRDHLGGRDGRRADRPAGGGRWCGLG